MDGVMQYFLMAFGAVFSVAGLVLIFRKAKPDAGAAKIEFLGQKLEANSTGIVVFLIGAAFLAAPLFVPAKNLQKAAPSTPAIYTWVDSHVIRKPTSFVNSTHRCRIVLNSQ